MAQYGALVTVSSTTINDPSTPNGKLDLSVVYQKQLSLLMSKKVALINATLANRDQMDAGTGIYYITRRNYTRDYTNGTQPNDTTSARKVEVPLDKAKEVSYEIETLDLKRLGARFVKEGIEVSTKMTSEWVDAKAKSVEAYMVGKLLGLATTTASANGITNLTLPTSPTAQDYRQNLWLQISLKLANLKRLVSNEYIGTNEEDYTLWASPSIKPLLLLATSNLGSDISTNDLKSGEITRIGGIDIVESTFLGNKFGVLSASNTSALDQNETFDFSACDMILIHKEALAFPFNMGQENTFILQTNGNIKNFHKFLVNENGGVALRPDLIAGFKVTQIVSLLTVITNQNLGTFTMAGAKPTEAELESQVVAKNPLYQTGNIDITNITATKATIAGKTIYDGSLTVTYKKA